MRLHCPAGRVPRLGKTVGVRAVVWEGAKGNGVGQNVCVGGRDNEEQQRQKKGGRKGGVGQVQPRGGYMSVK